MPRIEVSRTLVKSPPELWTELEGEALNEVVDGVTVRSTEPERSLAWEAKGVRGTAVLEPSGWGTKVTLTAEVEQLEPAAARAGLWSLWRPPPPGPIEEHRAPDVDAIRAGLEAMLEDLGSAHRRKPFARG